MLALDAGSGPSAAADGIHAAGSASASARPVGTKVPGGRDSIARRDGINGAGKNLGSLEIPGGDAETARPVEATEVMQED